MSFPTDWGGIFCKQYGDSTDNQIALGRNAGTTQINVNHNAAASSTFASGFSTTALAAGNWLAIKYSAATGYVYGYINGLYVGVTASPLTALRYSATGKLLFGRERNDNNAYRVDYTIREALIYDRILSGIELNQNYCYPFGTPDNPRLLLPSTRRYFFPSAAPAAYTLTSTNSSFTVTGQSLGLIATRLLTSDNGSVAITGQSANLLQGYKVAGDNGSLTLTGQDVTFKATRKIDATYGNYAITGQDAGLLATRIITADYGSITITGQDAGLIKGHPLAASYGSITITGQDANLLCGKLVDAAYGSISVTGVAVNLIYGASGTYNLISEKGLYAITGKAQTC